jgi:hypothetical protein
VTFLLFHPFAQNNDGTLSAAAFTRIAREMLELRTGVIYEIELEKKKEREKRKKAKTLTQGKKSSLGTSE